MYWLFLWGGDTLTDIQTFKCCKCVPCLKLKVLSVSQTKISDYIDFSPYKVHTQPCTHRRMHARTRALTHHSYTLKKKNPFVSDFSLNIYHGEKNLIPKINSLTTMLGGETCKTAVISLLYKSHYMFCIRFIHLAYVFSDACMYSRRKKNVLYDQTNSGIASRNKHTIRET